MSYKVVRVGAPLGEELAAPERAKLERIGPVERLSMPSAYLVNT